MCGDPFSRLKHVVAGYPLHGGGNCIDQFPEKELANIDVYTVTINHVILDPYIHKYSKIFIDIHRYS